MRILRMEIPLSFTMEQLQSDIAIVFGTRTMEIYGEDKVVVAKTAVPSSKKATPSTVMPLNCRKNRTSC